MAGHSSSNIVCRICKDVFPNQSFLDQHFLDLHPTKTSHHCDTCNEDFISELFLQIHHTEYHSTSTTPNIKQSSKPLTQTRNSLRNVKRFNSNGYLQNKISNALPKKNDSLFWCPVCFESFSKRENLRGHFHSSHTFGSGLAYVCELCDIEKPTAELLCWHLEVHSNNALSVNRFSKLRTCVSSIKKEDAELFKQLPVPKSTVLPELKTDSLPKREKIVWKENTVQEVMSRKLKLSVCKKQKRLQSQTMSKSFGRNKLNLPSSKKWLRRGNDTKASCVMKADGKFVGNKVRKVISGSTSKINTKTAKDNSLYKLEDNSVGKCIQRKNKRHYKIKSKNGNHKKNFTNHDPADSDSFKSNVRSKELSDENGLILDNVLGGSNNSVEDESTNSRTGNLTCEKIIDYETSSASTENKAKDDFKSPFEASTIESSPCDESGSISDKVLMGGNNSVEDESTYNRTTKQTCENLIEHETRNESSENKVIDDFQSSIEASSIESSVNSPEVKGDNFSSDLINKTTSETSFDTPVVATSKLSKKGKNRFKNLRTSCPTKRKKGYVINTQKFKKPQMTLKDSNVECNNQESNNKTTTDADSNSTEDKTSLVPIVNNETLHPPGERNTDTHLQPNDMDESYQWEIKIKSQPTYNKDEQISNKYPVELPDNSKNENECEKIANKITECFNFEVPIIITKDNSSNKKVFSEILTEEINKTQSMCGTSIKDSKSFYFENEESSIKGTNTTLANTSTNFESNYSENNASCGANDVFSQTSSTKSNSEEILTSNVVKECGTSNILEDLQGTASGKPVLGDCEENSQSISATLLEEQNDKPVGGGSSTLLGVETKSTNSQFKDKEHVQKDSKNDEANDLFEEVSCDKCSLKFYNQDDLFDHIGSHYDI